MEPAAVVLHRMATLQRIRRMTRWLDTQWRIPGTSWRFGLDPLLGLIPGLGDVITLCVSIWLLVEARRIGAPGTIMLGMIGNVALDFVIGEIPILGDIFDFAFKAHVRNLALLERWHARAAPGMAGPMTAANV